MKMQFLTSASIMVKKDISSLLVRIALLGFGNDLLNKSKLTFIILNLRLFRNSTLKINIIILGDITSEVEEIFF